MLNKNLKDAWWLKPNEDRISRIAKLDWEITSAIVKGHNPSEDDQFAEHRKEIKELRDQLKNTKVIVSLNSIRLKT